ncbi:signal peptidase I [Glutamicibacter protophormiae]|uniref:signal peptidase I n=1 Tax=Glutamicibacter protophormiae TaxID=37930 RepID=UPI00195898E7|nr:signal peptidase I [Glutamicibacter protophormiae]QRQ80079.1 signal peptidase I [Glutamicibacter protophormiae]
MNQIARPEAAITKRRAFYWVWRFAVLAVICALVAVIIIRAFFVDVFSIRSDSMQSTLNPGQAISVDRRAYDDAEPQRGDVIVFDGRGSFLPYARSSVVDDVMGAFKLSGNSHSYVKRVIGVGGDTVECCSADGRITVNGDPIDEPYLFEGDVPSEMKFSVQVPAGRIWVMGDHRSVSQDSRSLLGASGGGMISLDRVTGRATNIVWPMDQRVDIR